MKLKYQLTAGIDIYSFFVKPFTIVELECLTSIGSTDEHEPLEREIILEKPCAVIKVRNASDYDFFGLNTLLDEQLSISFTGDTKRREHIAKTHGPGACKPSRQNWNTFYDVIG